MKKLFTLCLALFSAVVASAQMTSTELWEYSTAKASTDLNADYIKNGIAVSSDGKYLFLSSRLATNAVAIYDATTGLPTADDKKYLTDLSGFQATYGGDIAVDGNGAIYANNVIISASGTLTVAKWENKDATPTTFISCNTVPNASNAARVGYGMDVRVNQDGDGFLIMHAGTIDKILYWQIENNQVLSQVPTEIQFTEVTSATVGTFARISIINDNQFWMDGNGGRPSLFTMTKTSISSIPTAISGVTLGWLATINVGVGGVTEFTLGGSRYGIFAANNHSSTHTTASPHSAIYRELASTGVAFAPSSAATQIPALGLGSTSDASHFVKPVVYNDPNGYDTYVYIMGGFNGIAAYKMSIPAPVNSPVFNLTDGEYNSPLTILLTSSTEGAIIRYTLDGNEPSETSELYVDGITITTPGTYTIKAKAWLENFEPSDIVTATYTIARETVTTPTFTPAEGTYTTSTAITIATTTENAAIRYTLDGTDPTEISTLYTGEFTISETTTVKAKAWLENYDPSETVTATYTIERETVATPTFSLPEGEYDSPLSITIASLTENAIIRYTLDGSDPTESSTVYTGELTLSTPQTVTIKVKAWLAEYIVSPTATITYTVKTATSIDSESVDGTSIRTEGNSIIVNTVDYGSSITVYTLQGKKVASIIAQKGDNTITLDKGVYVVTVNGKSTKVVL